MTAVVPRAFASPFRPEIDHPFRLADRALDRAGRGDLHLGADADQRLDVVLQLGGDARGGRGAVGRDLGPQLRHDLPLLAMFRPATLGPVMAGQGRLPTACSLAPAPEETDA